MQINDFFKKYISIDFKRDIELIKDINLHSILVIMQQELLVQTI